MAYEYFIPGPLPGMNMILEAPKMNVRKMGKRRVDDYIRMKKDWTIHIARILLSKDFEPLESVFIEFTWLEKNRKRDPDNIAVGKKFVLDGMVAAGMIKNDGWKQIQRMTDKFAVSKDTPGVIIKIEDANQPEEESQKKTPLCRNCNRPMEKVPVLNGRRKPVYHKYICRHCGHNM